MLNKNSYEQGFIYNLEKTAANYPNKGNAALRYMVDKVTNMKKPSKAATDLVYGPLRENKAALDDFITRAKTASMASILHKGITMAGRAAKSGVNKVVTNPTTNSIVNKGIDKARYGAQKAVHFADKHPNATTTAAYMAASHHSDNNEQ